ncbi:hypothetical protein [Sphingobacterium lactis]|uniref:hypothetical protein n=1 Tax=Sphingobacterium lactis TaxID=797291 RepID=UPI003DA25A29
MTIMKYALKFLIFTLAGLTIASCKKTSENVFTMYDDVQVQFHNNSPLSAIDYKLVNDGDSVYIDYTITSSEEEMYSVVVERLGVASTTGFERISTPVDNVDERHSFSRTVKLKMQRDGKNTFRVYAVNAKGIYMGDGNKKVTIEVAPSHTVLSNRRIFAPDTVRKDVPSFFSLMEGETFTYDQGKANAAKIDFGIRRRPDPRTGQANQWIYDYYSISANPNPYEPYDISTWEKRQTKFSKPVINQTNNFLYSWVSGSVIEEQAKSKNLDVVSTSFNTWQEGLAPGNVVFFQTPEGKYGVFLVTAVTADLQGNPFVNVSVKYQN